MQQLSESGNADSVRIARILSCWLFGSVAALPYEGTESHLNNSTQLRRKQFLLDRVANVRLDVDLHHNIVKSSKHAVLAVELWLSA